MRHTFFGFPVVILASVLIAGPAGAQETRQRQAPAPQSEAAPPRQAAPREAAPPPAEPPVAARQAPSRATPPAQTGSAQTRQQPRTAQPRGDAPREQPQPQPGQPGPRVAVPRDSRPGVPQRPSQTVIVGGYPGFYPYSPYGYGTFYFGPYGWYPEFGPYGYYRYPYRGYGYPDGPYAGYAYGYPTGEIRLRVKPREAEVYVDGYYAGVVDEFDGTFQALRLEEGPYTLQILAPGYEPLEVKVHIQAGRKMTYNGDLEPDHAP